MQQYGCRVAQGVLFDRPLPVSIFEERMKMGGYQAEEKKADGSCPDPEREKKV